MTDRLKELQHQRALAQEQLDWLDREIARESGAAKPTVPSASANKLPELKSPSALDAEAEKIIEQYRHAASPVKSDVKRGCFLYFFFAFGVLILGLIAFYVLRRL